MREEFAFFIKDLIFSVIYVNLNEMKVLREILNLLNIFFVLFTFPVFLSLSMETIFSAVCDCLLKGQYFSKKGP